MTVRMIVAAAAAVLLSACSAGSGERPTLEERLDVEWSAQWADMPERERDATCQVVWDGTLKQALVEGGVDVADEYVDWLILRCVATGR